MATNNFKPFATAANANVTAQADWEALPALLSGFMAGKASSAQVNKAIRQASFIAAALAQYTANKSGLDVLDDGDVSGFIAKMTTALGKDFQGLDATLTALAGLTTGANKLPYFTGTDTAAQTDLTSVGRNIIGKSTIADILTYLGLGEMPIIAKYGSALIGELVHWPMQQMPQEIWTDMKMEFIPYMGQSFDGSKYPLLAQLHPSLQLPADMRGEFVRGWDNGRGINTGQQLMSWSADSFKSHNHTPTTGSFFTFVATGGGQLVNGSNNPNVATVQTTNSVGGAETRPRSVAWNFIVRAK